MTKWAIWNRFSLTADKAEFMPALAEGLLLFGEVDVLGAPGANAGHLDVVLRTACLLIPKNLLFKLQGRRKKDIMSGRPWRKNSLLYFFMSIVWLRIMNERKMFEKLAFARPSKAKESWIHMLTVANQVIEGHSLTRAIQPQRRFEFDQRFEKFFVLSFRSLLLAIGVIPTRHFSFHLYKPLVSC